MGKIKYEIRSKVNGKFVPIYVNYQDSHNHFRIKTEFRVKPENWISSKEKIKPTYFDELDFSIKQKNELIQRFSDLKSRIEKDVIIDSVSETPIEHKKSYSLFHKIGMR